MSLAALPPQAAAATSVPVPDASTVGSRGERVPRAAGMAAAGAGVVGTSSEQRRKCEGIPVKEREGNTEGKEMK